MKDLKEDIEFVKELEDKLEKVFEDIEKKTDESFSVISITDRIVDDLRKLKILLVKLQKEQE